MRWVIATLVFALVAVPVTVAQLDRSGRTNLAIASMVPSGLGGFADARKAAYLVETRPQRAQELMEGVLEQRPIDIATLGLFARAAAENDAMDLASEALTIAAGRGWRDAYVQITVYGSALAQGNYEAASLRLEALARGQRDQSVVNLAIVQLQADGNGREVLARRLVESPGFEDNFAAAARANVDRAADFSATFARAEALGGKVSCGIASEIAVFSLNAADAEAARSAWPERCRSEAAGSLSFARSAEADPYGWILLDQPGVSTRPGKEEGSLYVKNRDLVERPIATKFMQLDQGRYSLELLSEQKKGRTPFDTQAELSVRLLCGSRFVGSNLPVEKTADDRYQFEVGPECGIQNLLISSRRGVRHDLQVAISPLI